MIRQSPQKNDTIKPFSMYFSMYGMYKVEIYKLVYILSNDKTALWEKRYNKAFWKVSFSIGGCIKLKSIKSCLF